MLNHGEPTKQLRSFSTRETRIGAQLLFEPAKRPAFEMLEHDTAQQTVGGDGGAPKIHGASAAARQCPRANGYQLRVIQ